MFIRNGEPFYEKRTLLNNKDRMQYLHQHLIRVFGVLHTLYWSFITKTLLYNSYPFKPHFYIVKLGFTGVYIICLIFVET